MSAINLNSFETICPRIYAYTTPGVTYHEGWLKIGYTATQTVDERIKQINHTGWIIYNKEWVHPAPFDETLDRQLTDRDFHKFLTGKYKIPRAADDLEWFKIDVDTAKKYLEEFCAGKTFRPLPRPKLNLTPCAKNNSPPSVKPLTTGSAAPNQNFSGTPSRVSAKISPSTNLSRNTTPPKF